MGKQTSARLWPFWAALSRGCGFFVMDLPQSDGIFVKAYLSETAEAFSDGHVAAFAFFGGVPLSILYDNTRLAVAKILGDGTRKRSHLFEQLQSHYLFDDRFGRPSKGNDKGQVEGIVGFSRRTFMVPVLRLPGYCGIERAPAGPLSCPPDVGPARNTRRIDSGSACW